MCESNNVKCTKNWQNDVSSYSFLSGFLKQP